MYTVEDLSNSGVEDISPKSGMEAVVPISLDDEDESRVGSISPGDDEVVCSAGEDEGISSESGREVVDSVFSDGEEGIEVVCSISEDEGI